MPTYQYACTECGHGFEQFQSFSDEALTECPTCGGRLRKVFNSVGIVFKGSGFYRNDSREAAKGKDGTGKDGKDKESVAEGKSDSSDKSGKSSDKSAAGGGGDKKADSSAASTGSSSGKVRGLFVRRIVVRRLVIGSSSTAGSAA